MKIFFIITGLGLGGAENQVCNLADSMAISGHDVSIISLTGDAIVLPTHKSITLYQLKMQKNFFGFIKALRQAKKIIKKIQPDVLHAHMFHANMFARILRILTPIKKLICTAHNSNEGGHVRMLAYRLTDNLSDLNTNVSQEALEKFKQLRAFPDMTKCQLIYNGIDTNKFIFNNTTRENIRLELNINSKFLFIAVGRLQEQKNYPNLINAFKLVFNQYPTSQLVIVGSGHLETNLKNMVNKLSLQDSITFLGIRNDVPAIMSAADCFVLSSDYEGFGLVIAEAMSCLCPVVSTDCGGTKEVINNYGFLTPIKDYKALANNMIRTIKMNAEDKEIQTKNAREHICRHFSLTAITNQWLDIYQEK